MTYTERQLTREEHALAMAIRDTVPRADRLEVCQAVCRVAEDQRDRANAKIFEARADKMPWRNTDDEVTDAIRREVWDALHFPRYRFFDVAIPFEGWAQFAVSREKVER